jgi:hypothetical protein
MNNINEQIKYYEENVIDYMKNPIYNELLEEANNISRLTYYEKKMLQNYNNINYHLGMISLHLQTIKIKK